MCALVTGVQTCALPIYARVERQHAELAEHEGDRSLGAHVAAELAERMADIGDGAHAVVGEAVHDHGDAAGGVALEIGSASCRERVCQYVKISVVAVSLKKKKSTKKASV